jgi:hypothetical protein
MLTESYDLVVIRLHGLPNDLHLLGSLNDADELSFVQTPKLKRHWTRREDEGAESFHTRIVADLRPEE